MEYCCHVLAGALKRYLDIVDRFQKRVYKAVVPAFFDSLELLAHLPDVTSLSLLSSDGQKFNIFAKKCPTIVSIVFTASFK